MEKEILVIDDDRDLSEMVEWVLQKAGYKVLCSDDAEEGIELAKTEKPDLILMDVMLPGVSGDEAVAILNSEPAVKNIPVLFVTGLLANKKDAAAGIKVGQKTYGVIPKPFQIEDFLAKVNDQLALGEMQK